MPKIDIDAVPVKTGSSYPGKLAEAVSGRSWKGLGDAGGLTQFGANLVTLAPGGLSSLRHWHTEQDEFLIVTAGTCTLVDDHGDTTLEVGDCAAFPKADANGHHLVNKTSENAQFLVIGTRTPTETGYYSDVDMMVTSENETFTFTRRDGSAIGDET